MTLLHAYLLFTCRAALQMEVSGGADVSTASDDRHAFTEIEDASPKKGGMRRLATLLLALTAPNAAEAFQAPAHHAVAPAALASEPAWRTASPTMMAGRGRGGGGRGRR